MRGEKQKENLGNAKCENKQIPDEKHQKKSTRVFPFLFVQQSKRKSLPTTMAAGTFLLPEKTEQEKKELEFLNAEKGQRLACQCKVNGDVKIEYLNEVG